MTNHKFRVGDKVTYIGPMKDRRDRTYTIARIARGRDNSYEVLEIDGFVPFEYNLVLVYKDSICNNCSSSCKSNEIKECPFYKEGM